MTRDKKTAAPPRPSCLYDDPEFFEGYKSLRQNDTGLNSAIEIPAMRECLPNLRGLSILDLGCGFGDFARHAREQGAESVVGIDASERMLTSAKQNTNDPGITYLFRKMEDFHTDPATFDLVVSSMAIHYVADYEALVQAIFSWLTDGGVLAFSVEHPICTANPIGWIQNENGDEKFWPLDCYQDEGRRDTTWFVDGVEKFHRTLETYVRQLLAAGFTLRHLAEPAPSLTTIQEREELVQHLRRPPLLVLAAEKQVAPNSH